EKKYDREADERPMLERPAAEVEVHGAVRGVRFASDPPTAKGASTLTESPSRSLEAPAVTILRPFASPSACTSLAPTGSPSLTGTLWTVLSSPSAQIRGVPLESPWGTKTAESGMTWRPAGPLWGNATVVDIPMR